MHPLRQAGKSRRIAGSLFVLCALSTAGRASAIYRKGELGKAAIDKGWSHQVALEERFCIGHNFCKGEGLSL